MMVSPAPQALSFEPENPAFRAASVAPSVERDTKRPRTLAAGPCRGVWDDKELALRLAFGSLRAIRLGPWPEAMSEAHWGEPVELALRLTAFAQGPFDALAGRRP